MRGGWRTAATAVLVLFLGACTFGNCSPTANNVQTTPSTTPTPSPTPTPAETPSPTPTPTATPAGEALAITSLPFHNGEAGVFYGAVSLKASGGTAPYKWSISGGSFPPGLALSSDGTVTGKNTVSGHFTFTVKVKDSAGASATGGAGLGVFSALSVTQPCANQCTVGLGCKVCGSFGSASGGLAPYQYAIIGGAVPDGMTLSGLSVKGAFPQTPLQGFSVSVRVTDQFGARQTDFANWYVYNPATLIGGTDCLASSIAAKCTATGWSYSGGSPTTPPLVAIVGLAPGCTGCPSPTGPPPGWIAVANGGAISISATVPSCSTSYDAIVTLVLTDSGHCATTMQSNPVNIRVNINCG